MVHFELMIRIEASRDTASLYSRPHRIVAAGFRDDGSQLPQGLDELGRRGEGWGEAGADHSRRILTRIRVAQGADLIDGPETSVTGKLALSRVNEAAGWVCGGDTVGDHRARCHGNGRCREACRFCCILAMGLEGAAECGLIRSEGAVK